MFWSELGTVKSMSTPGLKIMTILGPDRGTMGIRGPTEDIISYFTLMSSEIHYYDIIEKMGSWTLMSSEV